MATVQSILEALEIIAPSRFAFPFDRVGLQVGDPEVSVAKAVVALDGSVGAIKYAAKINAALLITHHPLLFDPISEVTTRSSTGALVSELIRSNIAFAAAHTNWDAAPGGINDTLASILDLKDIVPFGESNLTRQLKAVVTVPPDHAAEVIAAASAAGAGIVGNYSQCAFESRGTGSFLPGPTSNPTIGTTNKHERVEEVRIEMSLPESNRSAVQMAILAAHPYETPALDFYILTDCAEQPIGRVGNIEPITLRDFVIEVNNRFGTVCTSWSGGTDPLIQRVAVVGGAACGEWQAALSTGADVLVTGEVKQHHALEASHRGLSMIAAGHYATENPGCKTLCNRLREAVSDVEWFHFQPSAGQHGRPLEASKEW